MKSSILYLLGTRIESKRWKCIEKASGRLGPLVGMFEGCGWFRRDMLKEMMVEISYDMIGSVGLDMCDYVSVFMRC